MLDNPALYQRAVRLATTPVALLLIAALIVWELRFENGSDVHVVFSVLIVLLFPAVLVGPQWLSGLLSNRVAVYIGTRSYALYLIHRMAKGVVDRAVSYGSTSIPHELVHFVLIVVRVADRRGAHVPVGRATDDSAGSASCIDQLQGTDATNRRRNE